MNISFEGFNERLLTFAAQESVQAGDLVCIDADGTVKKAELGQAVVGLARSVRAGFAGVQVCGYASVTADAAVTTGWQTLVCDGENGIAADEGGRQLLVLWVQNGRAGVVLG